jgi:hypothetical protein
LPVSASFLIHCSTESPSAAALASNAVSAEAAKLQKRRNALAKRTASVKEKLRAEQRKFGAAVGEAA